MEKFPEIVSMKITSKCNYNCRYCYDSKKHKDLSFKQLKKIFKLFKKKGVEAIVLSGGEPLIRKDTSKILKELKNNKLRIYLDTHGDFFFKNKKTITKYVNTIGLPLDYPSNKEYYRSKENFENIIKILKFYSKSKKRPLIRIGTVVTKENIEHLKEIAKLLTKYKIDSWKIYQFIPIGPNGFANKNKLLISHKKFMKECEKVKKLLPNIKIIPSSRTSRKHAYFFVSSDGTVFMPKDDKIYHGDKELGNIFDKDIIKKWKKEVNIDNYLTNIKKTF